MILPQTAAPEFPESVTDGTMLRMRTMNAAENIRIRKDIHYRFQSSAESR